MPLKSFLHDVNEVIISELPISELPWKVDMLLLHNISLFLTHLSQRLKVNYSETCIKGPLKNGQNKSLNGKW